MDILQDHTYLRRQIYMLNIVSLLRLLAKMLFVVFFIGQYWYIFALFVLQL